MTKTVIAIYDELASAYGAAKDLMDRGFPSQSISMLINDNASSHEEAGQFLGGVKRLVVPGIGTVSVFGLLGGALQDTENSNILEALSRMGLPDEAAQAFAEGVRRGGTLLSLSAEDDEAAQAREMMDSHQPYDVNQRLAVWRQQGWQGFDPQAQPYTPAEMAPEQPDTDWAGNAGEDVTVSYSDFNTYEADFRNHFATTMVGSGYSYEQYQPAYRYGYDLAINQRNHEREWKDVEPEAREYWDQRNPGTWGQVKSAVRYAWDEIHDSIS